ncbi:MAG: hypothetical protein SGCHY_000789 [Lobulomycetales sp.]
MNGVKVKVSSTLNNDTVNFGKKHLTDGRSDTCWNSDGSGSLQWISLDFSGAPCAPSGNYELRLTFQGGFASSEISLYRDLGDKCWEEVGSFPCIDANKEQTFLMENVDGMRRLRLVFGKPTDMFGRIILYNLSLVAVDTLSLVAVGPAEQGKKEISKDV